MPSEIPSIRALDASASFHLELPTDPMFLSKEILIHREGQAGDGRLNSPPPGPPRPFHASSGTGK